MRHRSLAPAVLLNNARLCGIAGSAAALQAGDYIAVNPIKRDGVYTCSFVKPDAHGCTVELTNSGKIKIALHLTRKRLQNFELTK